MHSRGWSYPASQQQWQKPPLHHDKPAQSPLTRTGYDLTVTENPFKILGLETTPLETAFDGIPQAVLMKAYFIQSKLHHPDKNIGGEAEALRFRKINASYKELNTPTCDSPDALRRRESARFWATSCLWPAATLIAEGITDDLSDDEKLRRVQKLRTKDSKHKANWPGMQYFEREIIRSFLASINSDEADDSFNKKGLR